MPNFFFFETLFDVSSNVAIFFCQARHFGHIQQNYCVHVFSWCIVPAYKCHLVLVVAHCSTFGRGCMNPLYIQEQHRLLVADCTKDSNDN